MEIKDELVLNGMTWSASDNIEYNTIGAFQTTNSNTPGYYIVRFTGHAFNRQEQYTCHSFDPQVIFPGGELVFPAEFIALTRKTYYWYHGLNEEIPVIVKLKKVAMCYIELIQNINTKNKLPSRFKGYVDINPNLLSEHYHQIILDKI